MLVRSHLSCLHKKDSVTFSQKMTYEVGRMNNELEQKALLSSTLLQPEQRRAALYVFCRLKGRIDASAILIVSQNSPSRMIAFKLPYIFPIIANLLNILSLCRARAWFRALHSVFVNMKNIIQTRRQTVSSNGVATLVLNFKSFFSKIV